MSKPLAVDVNAVNNSLLWPVNGAQQRISVSATAAQSAAFITNVITLYTTKDCWIVHGKNPVAVVNDGNSIFLPGGFFHVFLVEEGDKVSVIRDTADGYLHITGGA